MPAAAAFENVTKVYRPNPLARGGVPAVRGVTFAVPAGAAFALLGPNRAGKTTLVKLLLTLARPTGGTVTRLGEPVTVRRTLARVGYMHENHAFPRYLSAAEVLHFYGGLAGLPGDDLPKKVDAVLDRVGLADRRREPISRFSKGMVQRLGLAQAILADPELLVLDEPTEGLDIPGRKLLREVVRGMTAAGKTVLLVSHALPEVEEVCTQAAVLVAGALAWAGPLPELTRGRSLEVALAEVYEKGAAA